MNIDPRTPFDFPYSGPVANVSDLRDNYTSDFDDLGLPDDIVLYWVASGSNDKHYPVAETIYYQRNELTEDHELGRGEPALTVDLVN